jgi:hypothetical protein
MKVVNAPELIISYETVTLAITLTTWNSAACFHGAATRKHDSWMIGGANLFFFAEMCSDQRCMLQLLVPHGECAQNCHTVVRESQKQRHGSAGPSWNATLFLCKKKVLDDLNVFENCSGKRQSPILVQNVNFGGIPGNGSQPLFPI